MPRQDNEGQTMYYGDGDGSRYDPLSLDIDIVVR